MKEQLMANIFVFEHDLDVACGNIVKNEQGRVVFGESVVLDSIL